MVFRTIKRNFRRRPIKTVIALYLLGLMPSNYATTALVGDMSPTNMTAVVSEALNSPTVDILTGGITRVGRDLLESTQREAGNAFNEIVSQTLSQSEPQSAETLSHSPDFYHVTGQAEVHYGPAPSEYTYLPVDELGRTTGAYALIMFSDRELAKSENHPQYALNKPRDPSGWGNNGKVSWTYPDTGKSSRGYFWNRSHLIADSLGGATIKENWVTGTRVQNVGKNDQKGGMAYIEEKVRNFLDNPQNLDCGVYYAAVPVYHEQELVPRTVIVDAKSCDDSINEHVVVENVMPGYAINYSTGDFKKL